MSALYAGMFEVPAYNGPKDKQPSISLGPVASTSAGSSSSSKPSLGFWSKRSKKKADDSASMFSVASAASSSQTSLSVTPAAPVDLSLPKISSPAVRLSSSGSTSQLPNSGVPRSGLSLFPTQFSARSRDPSSNTRATVPETRATKTRDFKDLSGPLNILFQDEPTVFSEVQPVPAGSSIPPGPITSEKKRRKKRQSQLEVSIPGSFPHDTSESEHVEEEQSLGLETLYKTDSGNSSSGGSSTSERRRRRLDKGKTPVYRMSAATIPPPVAARPRPRSAQTKPGAPFLFYKPPAPLPPGKKPSLAAKSKLLKSKGSPTSPTGGESSSTGEVKISSSIPLPQTLDQRYPDTTKAARVKQLEDEDRYTSAWALCWELNHSFMTKKAVARERCAKCNTPLRDSDGEFHSGFWGAATYLSCGHSGKDKGIVNAGVVCRDCDEDLVFELTVVGVKCSVSGCNEERRIDRGVIAERLKWERSDLLDEYITLLNDYQSLETFCCSICFSEVDIHQKRPKGKISPDCTHETSDCCTDCLREMIDSAVRNADWGNIRCPDITCNANLNSEGVKKYSSSAAFLKWEKFQLNKALEGDEEFRWCPGNNYTCGGGQLHPERGTNPRMFCSECDTQHCFSCRVLWHSDQTCAEYQAALTLTQSEAMIRRTTKRCPARGCGIAIEKREACLEVKHTAGCNTNFCWDCKAILGGGAGDIPHSERVATRHFSTCKAVEVRHCEDATFVDKPPAEGNDEYRDGWAVDAEYVRADERDGENMYCKGCDRDVCKILAEPVVETAEA